MLRKVTYYTKNSNRYREKLGGAGYSATNEYLVGRPQCYNAKESEQKETYFIKLEHSKDPWQTPRANRRKEGLTNEYKNLAKCTPDEAHTRVRIICSARAFYHCFYPLLFLLRIPPSDSTKILEITNKSWAKKKIIISPSNLKISVSSATHFNEKKSNKQQKSILV